MRENVGATEFRRGCSRTRTVGGAGNRADDRPDGDRFRKCGGHERQGLRINVQQDNRFVVARKTQRDSAADPLASAGNHSSHSTFLPVSPG